MVQEVADEAVDPLDLGFTLNSSFSGLFLLTSKLLADRRLDERFTVALGVALVELDSRFSNGFLELNLVNCADRTDTSSVTDVAATGVVQSLLMQAVGSTRVSRVTAERSGFRTNVGGVSAGRRARLRALRFEAETRAGS